MNKQVNIFNLKTLILRNYKINKITIRNFINIKIQFLKFKKGTLFLKICSKVKITSITIYIWIWKFGVNKSGRTPYVY